MTAQRPSYGDSVRLTPDALAGDLMRRHRKFHGYDSQAQLAERVGISQQNVMRIERGEWTSLGVARRVAGVLEVATDTLFDLSTVGYTVKDPAMLRAARQEAGLSRIVLGERVGLTAGALYPLEVGTRTLIWRDAAEAIAEALGVPVAELFVPLDVTADSRATLTGRAGITLAEPDAVPA